jgi:hypothetical protein
MGCDQRMRTSRGAEPSSRPGDHGLQEAGLHLLRGVRPAIVRFLITPHRRPMRQWSRVEVGGRTVRGWTFARHDLEVTERSAC